VNQRQETLIAERTEALDQVQTLASLYGFHASALRKPADLMTARRRAPWTRS
jgi:hypothetical protein